MKVNGHTNHTWLKIILVVLFLAIAVNECIVYMIQCYRWPTFPKVNRHDRKHQVLLIVADPQLQGYQDEPLFPIGTLARWDIDRYLRKTFAYAYEYSQPDVVLFLGDLFDEGSKATPMEYSQTLERFFWAFREIQHAKTVYIPGDNDIGGEGRDFMTSKKVHRFQQHFGNVTDIIKFGFIDYVKLNIVAHSLSQDIVAAAEHFRQRRTSRYTILLNHQTLMAGAKHFVYPVTKRLHPKLILSAHWHKAELFTCDDCLRQDEFSWTVARQPMTFVADYIKLDLSGEHSMHEIAVPTCSYRMGENNMGYVVAIIGQDGELQFTVLWLPRRYTMLLGYLVTILMLTVAHCMTRYGSRRR